MTHCYNVCILFFLFPRHQLAYRLGPFGKSFFLSFTVVFLLGLFSFYLDYIFLLRLAYKEGIESIAS